MMLHRSEKLLEIADRHSPASRFVRRAFDRSLVDFTPIFEPWKTGRITAEKESISQLKEAASTLSLKQIAGIIEFAREVNGHLKEARHDKQRVEIRRLLDIPSTGGLKNYKEYSELTTFEESVRRLVGVGFKPYLPDLRRWLVLTQYYSGKIDERTALQRAFNGQNFKLEKLPGGRLRITSPDGQTRSEHNVEASLKDAREKVSQNVAHIMFYLGRGYHPDYLRSYFLESLKVASKRQKYPNIWSGLSGSLHPWGPCPQGKAK
ncbi:MAG: hypothetical protein V1835_05340 [Candidatus Micrarchaeota archaeon]